MSKKLPTKTQAVARIIRRSTFLCAAALLLSAPIVLLAPQGADAEINRAPKPEKDDRRRRYVHPCPPGTEQFGSGPPDAYKAHCRKPVVGGYKRHGNSTTWYPNGNKRVEGDYIRGKKHGKWVTYHRNGKKKAVEVYYNGKRTQKSKYDRKGQAVKEVDRRSQRLKRRKKYKWRNNARY